MGLWMILNCEDIEVVALHTLDRSVVCVYLGYRKVRSLEGVGNDCEVMVLGCDVDDPAGEVLYRLIAAVMAELQPEPFPAAGQTQYLMSETDAHDRDFADQLLHRRDGV